jgi:hypothetical protein
MLSLEESRIEYTYIYVHMYIKSRFDGRDKYH